MKINISLIHAFSFYLFQYIYPNRPMYITEANFNANIYINIRSIPSKFQMCMHDRMKNIYAQNQSAIHSSYVW